MTAPVPSALLRVVRGAPSPEELAALVAVVSSRGGGVVEDEPAPTSRWASPESLLRQPLPHGPGAWQSAR